jgi:hypothetical protein
VIFDYVRVLFYADDMKLFLPVRGFQDCIKIQSDLNTLSECCERNSLFLNVDKCKTITFSRTRYPVKFAYMPRACGRHGWIYQKTVIRVQRSIQSEVSLNVLSSPEARVRQPSCVWSPFYDVRVDKVARVQRRFLRYALRGLGWTDTYDLPQYEHKCALLKALYCLYNVYIRYSKW